MVPILTSGWLVVLEYSHTGDRLTCTLVALMLSMCLVTLSTVQRVLLIITGTSARRLIKDKIIASSNQPYHSM